MAEDERNHENAAGADATGEGGGNVENTGSADAASGDPALVGESGGGQGQEGGRRSGDWDPGQVSGGGELY